VQPNGSYHYHGIPTGAIDIDSDYHSEFVGGAADGFPVYALYGYAEENNSNSAIQEMQSSWQVKSGDHSGEGSPAGQYDGTYTEDFEYIAGSGDLDQCNGRNTITPEFPEGTYVYFLTDTFPYAPRCVFGTVLCKHQTMAVQISNQQIGDSVDKFVFQAFLDGLQK